MPLIRTTKSTDELRDAGMISVADADAFAACGAEVLVQEPPSSINGVQTTNWISRELYGLINDLGKDGRFISKPNMSALVWAMNNDLVLFDAMVTMARMGMWETFVRSAVENVPKYKQEKR